MANCVLREKAKKFAKKIVFLCRDMKSNHKESILINQLLRSATSIGLIYTKHNILKEQKTLFSNLKQRKKSVMKQNIVLPQFVWTVQKRPMVVKIKF